MLKRNAIYENGERTNDFEITVLGSATISFDFDMATDYEKIYKIYNMIREEINNHVNLQIDTTKKEISICKWSN